MLSPNIGANLISIIITYNPHIELLINNINSLLCIGCKVALFDNTPDYHSSLKLRQQLEAHFTSLNRNNKIIWMGGYGNIGLSAAYNNIISCFIDKEDCDGFIFFDQDSTIQLKSLERLISSYNKYIYTCCLGVIGGYPLRNNFDTYRIGANSQLIDRENVISCSLVISSFSIVPITTFRKIGMFQEDFFIDHIDVDFCNRARNAGLMVLIDKNACFSHPIGHATIEFAGKFITSVSAPFRHYFQVRNNILSCRRLGCSKAHISIEIAKRIVMVVIQGVFNGELLKRCRYAYRGFVDGICGIGGDLPTDLKKLQ